VKKNHQSAVTRKTRYAEWLVMVANAVDWPMSISNDSGPSRIGLGYSTHCVYHNALVSALEASLFLRRCAI